MTYHASIQDPIVRGQMARVEVLLREAAGGAVCAPPLHAQLISPRAKRLRPALLLLAARFGPVNPGEVLVHTASGLEMLHEATLYHDDIVDEAALRRGELTAHCSHGTIAAAFSGSELLYRAADYFVVVPAPLRRAVGRAIEAVCRGQLREIEMAGDTEITVRARVRVMRDKTARLFGLASHLGAALARARPTTIRHLRRFGLAFGLCFQLADDLRDLTCSRETLGREPGSDLRDGIYSLPVLFGLASGTPGTAELRHALATLRVRQVPSNVARCLDLLRQTRGLERSLELLHSWVAAARDEVAALEAGGEMRAPLLTELLGWLEEDVRPARSSAGPGSNSPAVASVS